MTTNDNGPGVTWLAQRAGVSEHELLHNGTTLMSALESAARDAMGLASRLLSDDPATRKSAEAEARAIRTRLAPPSGSLTPEERFHTRVAEALATWHQENRT